MYVRDSELDEINKRYTNPYPAPTKSIDEMRAYILPPEMPAFLEGKFPDKIVVFQEDELPTPPILENIQE